VIKLSEKEVNKMIESCTLGIDYLLNKLKEHDALTNKDYEILGNLDDLIIEFEDLNRSFLQQQKAYNKLRLNKNIAITEHIDYNENKKEGI